MAVYTQLTEQDITQCINSYFDAKLTSYNAIAAGTENSNYRIDVTDDSHAQHSYIITIFEHLNEAQITRLIALFLTLQQHHIPVPVAIGDKKNHRVSSFSKKPLCITPFHRGIHPERPSAQQASAIALTMAKLHLIPINTLPLNLNQPICILNDHIQPYINKLDLSLLNQEQREIVDQELLVYTQHLPQLNALPISLIHSDLFRDNTLFQGEQLTAVLDFYDAHTHIALYDLAVMVNDWCFDDQNQFLERNYNETIRTYMQSRALSLAEKSNWPLLLRIAACRFWLSRHCLHQTLGSQLARNKHPNIFFERLTFHRHHTLKL